LLVAGLSFLLLAASFCWLLTTNHWLPAGILQTKFILVELWVGSYRAWGASVLTGVGVELRAETVV